MYGALVVLLIVMAVALTIVTVIWMRVEAELDDLRERYIMQKRMLKELTATRPRSRCGWRDEQNE